MSRRAPDQHLQAFTKALDAALAATIARCCRDAPQRAGEAQRAARARQRDRRDAARAHQAAAHRHRQQAHDAAREAQRTLIDAIEAQDDAFCLVDEAVQARRAEAIELMTPLLAAQADAEAAAASADAALAAEQTALDALETSPELRALEHAEQASFEARIAELTRTLGQPRWHTPALERTPDATAAIAALGRPTASADPGAESARLTAAIAQRDAWIAFPASTQTLLLTHLAARLRALQDQPQAPRNLRPLFSKLTAWSATHRPGFVHGLAQAHAPQAGTWLADAERTWDALQPTEPPVAPAAPAGPGRKRREARAAPAPDAPLPDAPLPDDWPHRDRLRAARVLLVGSDLTHDQLGALRDTFGFARLDHTSGHKPRRVQASATAIQAGRYDLVIVLTRWLSHKVSIAVVQACKHASVPMIQAGGYGIATLKAAFEGKLEPDVDD
ncbi:MAG: hypothetical protein R3F60_32180 [bacterium]